jgi:dipeptidyl aminopeptidase/acylaminoacyl peptidase
VVGVAAFGLWRALSGGRAEFSMAELRNESPIVLVMADAHRAGYASSGDLYVTRHGITALRRLRGWPPLTRLRAGQSVYGTYAARWSPDRRRIALNLSNWFGDPYGQAAVTAADGSNLRTLSRASIVGDVIWSHDSDLVYAYGKDLWLVPSAGRKVRLWHAPDKGSILEVPNGSGIDWSADGRHLVVLTTMGLVEVGRDGRDAHILMSYGFLATPRFSPDGRQIAFIRQPRCLGEPECRAGVQVYVVGVDGHGLRRLTSHAHATSLIWSADGDSLIVTQSDDSGDEASTEVDIINARGGDLHRIAASASALSLSPDGRKILIARDDDLWVMTADGGRQTRLPFNDHGLIVLSADWGT